MSTKLQIMKREFSMFSAMALAFAFVSPIVALYSVLGIGLQASGPAFMWGGLILYAGQFVVVLTLGMLASKWAEAGGIYQWSRNLLGNRYGWLASWTYICTLLITLPAVAYAGAVLLAPLFDMQNVTSGTISWLAVGLLVIVTIANLAGRIFIKILMVAVIVAEAIGSVGVAIWLLIFDRNQPLEYLSPAQLATFDGVFFSAPLIMAIAFSSYFAIGFESASSIAEEVHEPKRAVPKAMVISFFSIMAIVMVSAVAFTLAIPSNDFIANPEVAADPAVAIMAMSFPEPVFRGLLALFVIAFTAALLTIQITVSRIIFATARNHELPFSNFLSRLSGDTGLPRVSVVVTAVISCLLFIPFQSEGIQLTLISFSSVGFFISFLFPVLGLAIARLRGTWKEDDRLFLGRAGRVIPWIALIWLVFQIVNVAWPRGTGELTDWSTVIGVCIVVTIGLVLEPRMNRRRMANQGKEATPGRPTEPTRAGEFDYLDPRVESRIDK